MAEDVKDVKPKASPKKTKYVNATHCRQSAFGKLIPPGGVVDIPAKPGAVHKTKFERAVKLGIFVKQ